MKSKKYLKDGLALAGTGIGLSVASGLDPTGSTGKIASALPTVGGIYSTKIVLDSLDMLSAKSKKKKYF